MIHTNLAVSFGALEAAPKKERNENETEMSQTVNGNFLATKKIIEICCKVISQNQIIAPHFHGRVCASKNERHLI